MYYLQLKIHTEPQQLALITARYVKYAKKNSDPWTQ